jgi:hypothetical protein
LLFVAAIIFFAFFCCCLRPLDVAFKDCNNSFLFLLLGWFHLGRLHNRSSGRQASERSGSAEHVAEDGGDLLTKVNLCVVGHAGEENVAAEMAIS